MRYKQLDLNLLVALDALLAERNITKAAHRLTVSQSAMSGMLSRLRDYFENELLVQVGRSMQRTPLGDELAGPVRDLLMQIDSTIALRHDFVPQEAQRHIRIAASDYGVSVLLAPLIRRLQRLAPRITVELMPLLALSDDIIRSGQADLLAIPEEFAGEEHPCERLVSDNYHCMVWIGNEAIGAVLDMASFLACGHVTPLFGPFRYPSLDERFFREHGIERRLQVMTPDFQSMAQVILETDLVATLPSRLAKVCAERYAVRLLDPPIALPPMRYCMQWHRHHTTDPGHRWVRAQLAAVAREIDIPL
jgi:LysR family nod box-dependent transcriptional activator